MNPRTRQTQAIGGGPATAGGWFVYVLRCRDGSLYTGATTDVQRRLGQHNAGRASRYTRCRLPVELAYEEAQPSQSAALRREHQIKSLPRADKLRLVAVRTAHAAPRSKLST